jgi:hypothetical protein
MWVILKLSIHNSPVKDILNPSQDNIPKIILSHPSKQNLWTFFHSVPVNHNQTYQEEEGQQAVAEVP